MTGSCPAGSNTNPAAGCPDGYKALTTNSNGSVWQHGITVWRNNNYTPVFDSGYIYRLAPLTGNGGVSLDIANGSTADGTTVQQYTTWNGTPQMFNLLPDGPNWHIVMNANNTKCIDLAGSGSSLGNSTQVRINDCQAGKPSEAWDITADAQTGAFIFKNVQANRCMDEMSEAPRPGCRCKSGIATAGAIRSSTSRPSR